MLKALFGSSKDDPYNQALDHFRRLRSLPNSDPAYAANLTTIVRLCQLAIRQRPADGDAHILLANAFLLLALAFPFSEVYPYALSRAAAAIYQWKHVPMHSKERAIGDSIFRGVNDQLASERPQWMGPAPPTDLRALHFQFYQSALDPASLDTLSRLIADSE